MNQLLLDARFDDFERMCAEVRQWDLDFRPLVSASWNSEAGRVIQSVCGPLELGYARFRIPLHQQAAPPSHRVTFVVLEKNVRRLWWRGFDESTNTVLISRPGSDFESFSGTDFSVHTVSVTEEALMMAAATQELKPLSADSWPEVVHLKAEAAESLRQRLRRLSSCTGDTLDAYAVLNALARLVCDRGRLPQTRPAARMRDIAIRRCLAALTHGTELPPDPETLREIAGVSERTLEYAFRERFGLTPAAFLRVQRLGRLRADLLWAAPGEAQVGDLAARYGFWHTGHLSAQYLRAFGEHPSQTLALSQRR